MYIKVLFIEENDYDLNNIKSPFISNGHNRDFKFLHIKNQYNIKEILSSFNPHVILLFDNNIDRNISIIDKEKYLMMPSNTPPDKIGEEIINKFLLLLNKNNHLLFSIITPVYKTSNIKLQRLYDSLLDQTYNNWEWIVFDDSPQEHTDTYNFIDELSKKDNRILLFRSNKNSGIIGEVKKTAFSLGNGDVLVEVDHDDELVDTCLEYLLKTYLLNDEIGFVYGHCCEIFENSDNIIDYGENWAYGYGSYKKYNYKDKEYKVAIAPNINSKTIRHIIGIPNHVRSWRKDVYQKIGGHNKNIHVADDYEIFIRTFLNTKIAKIDTFTYIQYFEKNSSNTQIIRNSEIQRLVYYFSNHYNDQIHNRFIELGVDDFTWDNGIIDLNINRPIDEHFTNLIISDNIIENELSILANYYKTDKGTIGFDYHGFTNIYYEYWNKIRNDVKSILEIGIGFDTLKTKAGASLKMLRDFFPNAIIHGIDMDEYLLFESDRIKTYLCDQNDILQLEKIMSKIGEVDIIIDDGSHHPIHQQTSFGFLFKYLKKGGLYIIEDIHTSIWGNYGLESNDFNTSLNVLKRYQKYKKIDSIYINTEEKNYLNNEIESVEFFYTKSKHDDIISIIKKKNINKYYGQFLEDKIIEEYFDDDYIGGCIDIGSIDGINMNNTKYFEDKGWYNLCVEPNPDFFKDLKNNRKNVIDFAISNFNEDLIDFTAVSFDDNQQNELSISSLNIDNRLVERFVKAGCNLKYRNIKVSVRTLDYCIENYYKCEKIDFINIDTEGTELEVLKGFDINRWQPKLIVVENNFNDIEIENYLKSFGYIKDKRLEVNDFYIKNNNKKKFLIGPRLGDFIHSLYAAKCLCDNEKCDIYLTDTIENVGTGFFIRGLMNTYNDIYSSIIKQPYVDKFLIYNHDNPIDDIVDLRHFLSDYDSLYKMKWNDTFNYYYNIGYKYENEQWLYKLDDDKYKLYENVVVINVSAYRYCDEYDEILENILKNNECVFISGDDGGYNKFKFKNLIKFNRCDSFHELYSIIEHCKFFIGNQSMPLSVAHGLFKNHLGLLYKNDAIHYKDNFNENYFWFDNQKRTSDNFNGIYNFIKMEEIKIDPIINDYNNAEFNIEYNINENQIYVSCNLTMEVSIFIFEYNLNNKNNILNCNYAMFNKNTLWFSTLKHLKDIEYIKIEIRKDEICLKNEIFKLK